jgi:hypothetical protein
MPQLKQEFKELETRTLGAAELAAQQVVELPAREALSLANANLAAPINAALGLNVLSDNSLAAAVAAQWAPITQRI